MNIIRRIKAKLQRDGLFSLVLAFLMFPLTFRRRHTYRKMLQLATPKQRFSEIYQNNLWNSGESVSGEGSEVSYTEKLRNWLLTAIAKNKINIIVDAACGDFNWFRLVLPQVDVEYFGFDIVDSVVSSNNKKYATKSIHFDVADICQDKLPKCDLLVVRDLVFHLSYEDVDRFLRNIARVDYKYLLTTTHIVDENFINGDIVTGDSRTINLFQQPFSFDENCVLDRIDDSPIGSLSREMILVEKSNVPRLLMRNL